MIEKDDRQTPMIRRKDRKQEMPQFLTTPEQTVLGMSQAALAKIGIAAVSVGSVAATTSERVQDTIAEMSFTPAPDVSSTGTEVLISANNAMLDYGPAALATGLVGLAGYHAIKHRNPEGKIASSHAFTHQDKSSRRKSLVLTGGIISAVASASGLAAAASSGASEPVQAMAKLVDADPHETPIVTGYTNTPYNPSVIDFDKVRATIEQQGGTAIPFLQALGEVKNPAAKSNPSSAPIFAVPGAVLEKGLGVSMPATIDCGDMSVLVGKQLGAEEGATVLINDRPAKVAGTLDMKPGLDRVAAVTSLEQASACLYPDMPATGAIALGLNGKKTELQEKLRAELGMPYSARSFDEFEQKYNDFWEKSVAPPEMLLILGILAVGAAAIGNTHSNETKKNTSTIATLISQGVSRKDIKRAYALAAHRNTVLATGLAAVPTTALIALNNSSQFGLEEKISPSVIGAGYVAALATTAFANHINNRVIDNIDTARVLRGDV